MDTEIIKDSAAVYKKDEPSFGVILALETGISGGSVSLLRDGQEIDRRLGSREISRAEDILDEIDKILERNRIPKKSVDLTAFSRGPGSFTGLRIGAAIAKGLGRSLGCRLSAESVLESLSVDAPGREKTIAAVPFGNRQVCWQYFVEKSERAVDMNKFADKNKNKTFVSEIKFWNEHLKDVKFEKIILHKNLYETLFETAEKSLFRDGLLQKTEVICAGENLARVVGLKAFKDRRADDTGSCDLIYPYQY